MAQEIGAFYVSLLPSGRGFEKAAKGQAESAFQGAEKSSTGFFSKLTSMAKVGAAVVGGMVAAVGALAVSGGIARALNIEDATAKLKGLGHDTQVVDQIMSDALASVKGTAFGLDAAATTAASAVAAGIKPGQELTKYLTLTADAATIAGVSMQEMGSIINQVTSKGYAGMENLNRLTERGIPIMQWLAKEYGVTADELSDMVSRGEVDAETFRRAIENNIAGAALASGDTTRGAFANMMAALSRLGLAFVGDGLSGAKTFFNEITIILDGLESRIGPWVQGIQDKLGGLDLVGFGDKFLTGLDSFLADFDSTPLGLLFDALKPLIPVFKEIGEKVGPVLAETLSEIGDAIAPLVPLITDALIDAIVELAPPLADLLAALLPIIPPLVELVVLIFPLLIWFLEQAVPHLVDFIESLTELTTTFTSMFDVLDSSTSLEDWGQDMRDMGGPIGEFSNFFLDAFRSIAIALGAVAATWNVVWSQVAAFFGSIGEAIKAKAREVWESVPEVFRSGVERAVSWVKTLPERIGAFFAGAGQWLVQSGRDLIDGFISGIKQMMGPVGEAVDGVLAFASGFFPHSPAKRGTFAGAGWTAVGDGGASLMEQFASGAERFKTEFSFGNLAGAIGGVSVAAASGPRELVIVDSDRQLIGRMQVEAAGQIGEYDAAEARTTFGRLR